MSIKLEQLFWPAERIGEAVEALARQSRRAPQSAAPLLDIFKIKAGESLGQWIEAAADQLGLEAEPVETTHAEVERLVQGGGPAILRLPVAKDRPGLLAIFRSKRGSVLVLAPDLTVHRLPAEKICAALRRELEAPLLGEVNQLLVQAGVPKGRLARSRSAILNEQLGQEQIGGCWLLRSRPGANFWHQALQARLPHRLAVIFILYVCQYLLAIGSWWILGAGVLGGQLERGALMVWALLLLTGIPFQSLAVWLQGGFAITAGSLLKQRLLYGALRLEPEEIKHQGAGQLLGRVIESGAVESLALKGGFFVLSACVELLTAAMVFSAGAGGGLHLLLLLIWSAFALLINWRYFRLRQSWTQARIQMTNDTTERMVGYRTRLAQEAHERWHEGEDQVVEA